MHRKRNEREHSSVGLEHLPYKQRVGGSTPSAPTKKALEISKAFFVLSSIEVLPFIPTYKEIAVLLNDGSQFDDLQDDYDTIVTKR